MKKYIAMLLAAVMLLGLTACGSAEEAPAATTAPAAVEAPAATAPAAETQEVPAETEEDKSEIIVEDGAYAFTFNGVELIPGEAFSAAALPAAMATTTIPSCAFTGTDNVYTYDTVEIIAYDEGQGEHLYSVYLLDPNTPTDEGLLLGDSVERMIELYGENYTKTGDEYAYYRGETILVILAKNDVVNTIEIRLAA